MKKIDLNAVKKFEIEELEERLEMTMAEAEGEWRASDENDDGQNDQINKDFNGW